MSKDGSVPPEAGRGKLNIGFRLGALGVLVALLTWWQGGVEEEAAVWTTVVVENSTVEPRVFDVVWERPTGRLDVAALRSVPPLASVRHLLRGTAPACIRTLDRTDWSVRDAWFVGPGAATRENTVRIAAGAPAGAPAEVRACPPEMLRFLVRPRLGWYADPASPGEVRRERLIRRAFRRLRGRKGR